MKTRMDTNEDSYRKETSPIATPGSYIPESRKHILSPLTGLLVFCFFVHLLTMPSVYYRGDNSAPRLECHHLLHRGYLGIELDDPCYGPFVANQEKGQYYYRNPVTGRYHSKYGLANTLAYLPPLLAYWCATGHIDQIDNPCLLLYLIYLSNSIYMLLGVFYMYRIASLYSGRDSVRIISVLLVIYPTFLWYYLRAPALEVYQVGPFLGFAYHLVAYLRQTCQKLAARSLAFALAWLTVLVFTKLFFFVLAGTMAVAILLKRISTKQMADTGKRYPWHTPAYLFIALVTILVCVQATNLLRFGSPLSTGYEQWRTITGEAVDRFSLSYVPASLSGFFLIPGNSNILVHFPLIVLCLFAWIPFIRRYRTEGILLATIVSANLLPLCCFSNWPGSWSYGPRYTIHLLVIASIPGVLGLDWLIYATRQYTLRSTLGAILILTSATSLALQVAINGMLYFADMDLRAKFQDYRCEQANAYFSEKCHTGLIAWDLFNHRTGKQQFPPLKMVIEQEKHYNLGGDASAGHCFWLGAFVTLNSASNYKLSELLTGER